MGPQIAKRAGTVLRRLAAPVAIAGLGTAAWLYLGGGYPNFDAAYAVVWGDQLVEGSLPDYAVEYAPTPHPLATTLGALAALVGDERAYDMLAVAAYVSFAALVWGVYALGRKCYSWRAGLLAALIVATSFTILSRTAASYFDTLTAALIVLAGVLEAHGRRGVPVLVVLAVAGLQRPEAWLMAAGYWLYLAPAAEVPQRIRLAALAAAAPVLWATVDLIVTGDPIFSFSGTRAAAHWADGGGGAPPVLSVTAEGLREILRLPVLLGGAVGALLALAFLRGRSRVPLALLIAGVVSFVGLGVAGLPLLNRFLFLPAAALAIFFGVAALGWLDQPELGASSVRARRLRAAWIVGGAALLLVLIASVPAQVDRLQGLRDEVRLRVRAVDDLRAFADSRPAGTVLRRCERVYLPNEQLIPILSYALDRTPRDVVPAPAREPRRGAYFEPRAELRAANVFFFRGHAGPPASARFGPVAESRYWTVRARGCGRGPA